MANWQTNMTPLQTTNKIAALVGYSKCVAKVYRRDIKSIEDPQQREAAFKLIADYIESLNSVEGPDEPEIALKSVVTLMKSAKEQFTNLVWYACNMKTPSYCQNRRLLTII
jgi:hypothetical protein